jgi:maltooligosyltrehalose trehalohydrolase
MQKTELRELGAVPVAGGVRFTLWAPGSEAVEVVLDGSDAAIPLDREEDGWFSGVAAGVAAGTRYRIRLNGSDTYPDPWSRAQPDGVHGASEVVDPGAFRWTDGAWRGVSAADLVIMEVHVGTATPQGTFDALIERLPHYVRLGATAVEVMPVSEFSGMRNWGYDGVYLFAATRAYGGPAALQRFVDAAHGHGVAVILDVVYNHFGPEGNYLPAVTGGRIFTEKHHTPWGAAVNYDDAGSAAVRATVLGNVQQWIRDYHIDGLRLDATHAIMDESATHILQQIADTAREAAAGRNVVIIAEDERNERRLLLPTSEGGYGLDAVWADDTHHVIRRLAAGDTDGYYAAYEGTVGELAQALRQGWLYDGRYYAPTDEERGTSSVGLQPSQFVHCIQNHDQVGNRAFGERLNHDIDLDLYRAVSALLLLAPYTPLLWMGQEWGASAPFLYFTDHPPELGQRVTEGRREEFSRFAKFRDPALRRQIPDPQSPETFQRSRLDWDEVERDPHRGVLALYRELLQLRRSHAATRSVRRDTWRVEAAGRDTLLLERSGEQSASIRLFVNFRGESTVPLDAGDWQLLLHTEQARFGGAGDSAVTLAGSELRLKGAVAVLLQAP